MVRMAVRGDVAEGDGVVGGRLDLPARPDSGGVPVEEECQEHPGIVGHGASTCVGRSQRTKIELPDYFHHEAGKVIVGEPVFYGLGENVWSRSVYGLECGRHLFSPPLIRMFLFYPICAKSDRLLGHEKCRTNRRRWSIPRRRRACRGDPRGH